MLFCPIVRCRGKSDDQPGREDRKAQRLEERDITRHWMKLVTRRLGEEKVEVGRAEGRVQMLQERSD